MFAVKAAIGGMTPLSIFDNKFWRSYLFRLDCSHSPPHCLERIQLSEVTMDLTMAEVDNIFDERREELHDAFASAAIDFWTDSHRKESYGALVVNVTANKYELSNGLSLFMSDKTKEATIELHGKDFFASQKPRLECAEFVLNFEKFDKPKTIDNVAQWMDDTFRATRIKSGDFSQMCADGGSNAIGSIAEYEVVSREDRSSTLDFTVCYTHQNERSGIWGSGTGDFKDQPNRELGSVLVKNHTLQTSINRNGTRLGVYRSIQNEKGRKPQLQPRPSVETRWHAKVDESERGNIVMGDMCETHKVLLAKGGCDYNLLTPEEKDSGDISR